MICSEKIELLNLIRIVPTIDFFSAMLKGLLQWIEVEGGASAFCTLLAEHLHRALEL